MLESFVSDAFEYKKLTEAEQKARGILGRLVGVIADTQKPTRNGRKYSEKLWENVFENPIMKEKIANRCCFGELNHPSDRSEVDLERVAICLAEYPKKNANGQLYGVFDILSTPNGRILKALCDYGCKIGISSRGQGDLITDDNGDEAVDPDTYDCECFDAVIVPGVEIARLKYVNEGLEKDSKSLKAVLTEELATATVDERNIMEETLGMLKIKLDEANIVAQTDIQSDSVEEALVEDVKEVVVTTDEEQILVSTDENGAATVTTTPLEATDEEDKEIEAEIETAEIPSIDLEDAEDVTIDEIPEIDVAEVESEEVESEDVAAEDAVEDEQVDDTDVKPSGDEQTSDEEAPEADSDVNNIEEPLDETEEKVEEAIDSGAKFLVNSLKEALAKNSELESIVKSLQEALAVRDAKVNDLVEECDRYKASIARLSSLAKSTKDLKESVSSLEQTLAEKEQLIESQKSRIERLAQDHKKSVANDNEITTLTESLNTTKANYDSKVKTLTEELEQVRTQANEKAQSLTESLAKAESLKEGYRKLANNAINKYIEVKADILGLTTKDIKRKLGESYTMSDIDQVCEDLKSYQLNVSKLPFSVDRKVSVKVNESKNVHIARRSSGYEDDDVDSTLLKLAAFED